MRKKLRSRSYVRVSGSFYLYISVLLLTLPLKWVLAFIICSAIHEVFHILCIKLCSVRIYWIEMTSGGVKLHTEDMSVRKELLCAISGPIGGLIPVFAYRIFPEMALISLLLTLYNMLPVYPADGGRVLHCMLRLFLSSERAEKISECAETVVQCVLITAGFYGLTVHRHGYLLLILCVFCVVRAKMEKHLANSAQKRYNIPITDKEVPL